METAVLCRITNLICAKLSLPVMLGFLTCTTAHAGNEASPTAEFDIPYQVRVLSGGAVLEISGSFSWALPQNVQAALASAPEVRVVRLESPGGHLLAALQVVEIIQRRGLDTYVGRLCVSACTVAFLGGRQRWLAPGARLGFHQAYAPGFPSDQANGILQTAYRQLGVPPSFIAHVLQTPHTNVWFPKRDELDVVHVMTPPNSLVALDDNPSPRLADLLRLLPLATDGAVRQFAKTLFVLLGQLQEANPEACWAFAHDAPNDPRTTLPPPVLDAIAMAKKSLAETERAGPASTSDVAKRKKMAAELVGLMRAKGQDTALQGVRAGAAHAMFCPSFQVLLEAVLALPDLDQVLALRGLLASG
jgi:hypothetical protein